MVLTVLYWVFLVIGAVFGFIGVAPADGKWNYGPLGAHVFLIILLVLIGLKSFPFQ